MCFFPLLCLPLLRVYVGLCLPHSRSTGCVNEATHKARIASIINRCCCFLSFFFFFSRHHFAQTNHYAHISPTDLLEIPTISVLFVYFWTIQLQSKYRFSLSLSLLHRYIFWLLLKTFSRSIFGGNCCGLYASRTAWIELVFVFSIDSAHISAQKAASHTCLCERRHVRIHFPFQLNRFL